MPRLTIRVEACTEILALLIVIAWADEKLEDREKASLRSAASVLNLNKELRDRLDKMLEKPLPLDQILIDNLGAKERSFAYVAAVWQAGVDQDVDPREEEKLREVKEMLGIDDARAHELDAIARELGRPHEKSGWADDLAALFKAIPARLEARETEVAAEDVEVAFK